MKRHSFLTIALAVCLMTQAQIVREAKGANGKYGFKDANGSWVVSPQYDDTSWDKECQIGVIRNWRFPNDVKGIVNKYGKAIIPIGTLGTSNLYECKDGFIKYLDSSDKWGVVNLQGETVISPQYDYISLSDAGKGYIEVKDFSDKHGLVNLQGKTIISPQYKSISLYDVDKGYIEIKDFSDKCGLVNLQGETIISPQYKSISLLYVDKGYIEVKDFSDKCGLVNLQGKEVIKPLYKDLSIYDVDKGYVKVKDFSDKCGLVNLQGKEVIKPLYKEFSLYDFDKGYIKVKDFSDRWGLVNLQGKEVVKPMYKEMYLYVDKGYIHVKDFSDKEGILSEDGKILVPCKFSDVWSPEEGLFRVKKDGKYGYWEVGKELIPCIYDDAGNFKNGVATVKKDGEVMLIKNPLRDASTILIAEGGVAKGQKKKSGPAVSRYPAPDSDVDKNIPTAKRKAENTFAFIIANENYADAPVPYSLNDGRMFREYCSKALGLPEKNINMYEDATFGTIITAVEKMKEIADAYEGEASVIFYYAGHGFPDDKQQSAYLLPIDGDASSITTTGYSLAKLYKEMASLKLRSAVVFMDACFSGAKREDKMLTSSRGVAIKVKSEVPQGNLLVFSAAQGDETAHQMEEKHHGLFTYFLLKELQATGGDVDMGTLTDYVTKQVKRQSVVINNKRQTPTVVPSANMTSKWRTMKLK